MQYQFNEQLSVLLAAAIVANIGLYLAILIVGGESRAKRFAKWELRVVRACLGYPVIWVGQGIVKLGKGIRG